MNVDFVNLPGNQAIVTDTEGNMKKLSYIGNIREILLNENIKETVEDLKIKIANYSEMINSDNYKLRKLTKKLETIKISENIGYGVLAIVGLLVSILLSIPGIISLIGAFLIAVLIFVGANFLKDSYIRKIEKVETDTSIKVQEKDMLNKKLNALNFIVIDNIEIPTYEVINLESMEQLIKSNSKVKTLKKW